MMATSVSGTPDHYLVLFLGNTVDRMAETVFTRDMSENTTHTHECRDCGEGFNCSGTDHWNGCDVFDGLCDACAGEDFLFNQAAAAEVAAERHLESRWS